MLEQFKEALRNWVGPAPEDQQKEQKENQNASLAGIALEYGWDDLRNGTENFCESRRLGAGAAGAVYKGCLRGGTEVAVKVLKDNGTMSGFEDEVRVLSRFRHPNLVTLLGWGAHENDRFLIYEILLGGDVEKKLQKSKKKQEAFPSRQRLCIALDAACGLSYMVNSQPKAFHRDIKPPNILLDANGTAKMADFGLAGTIKQDGKRHLTVENISGTPGYACPQYIETGRVSELSEVYSFGTVMLELLMNEHPALCGPNGQLIYPLLSVVQPAAPGACERILSKLDPTADWPENLVKDVAKLSLSCVGHPDMRPSFENLVQELRSLVRQSASAAPNIDRQPQLPQQSISVYSNAPPTPAGDTPAAGIAQEIPIPPPPRQGRNGGNGFMPPTAEPQAAAVEPKAKSGVYGSLPPGAVAAAVEAPPPAPQRTGRNSGYGSMPPRAEPQPAAVEPKAKSGVYGSIPPGAVAAAVEAPPLAPQRTGRHKTFNSEVAPVAEQSTDLGDIILECVHAEGVDFASWLRMYRAIGIRVEPGKNGVATIGRQSQIEFFERLLPKKERLTAISRVHFELMWDANFANSIRLRRVSPNPLLVNSRPLATDEIVVVQHGACIGFSAVNEDSRFLELRLCLRGRGEAASATQTPPAPPMPLPPPLAVSGAQPGTAAVLECTNAVGIDISSLPVTDRIIELPLGSAVEIGKQRQTGLFNALLRTEPKWLSYISRNHCRALLSYRSPSDAAHAPGASRSMLSLTIENLSSNVVLVADKKLSKDRSESIPEGGSFAFVAAPDGPTEIKFLEFMLRRVSGAKAQAL